MLSLQTQAKLFAVKPFSQERGGSLHILTSLDFILEPVNVKLGAYSLAECGHNVHLYPLNPSACHGWEPITSGHGKCNFQVTLLDFPQIYIITQPKRVDEQQDELRADCPGWDLNPSLQNYA